MTKMLGDISNHVANFKALDAVCQTPEVAVDYRDMDYENKLDFIDGVEPPLEHVTQVLAQAKQLIETLELEFEQAQKDEDEGPAKITEINQKLRDDADLQVLAQQESEVRTTLADLKERRKRFADCNVQS